MRKLFKLSRLSMLLMAGIFLFSTGCKSNCDSDGVTVDLPPAKVSLVFPYWGDEQLRFLKNGTDTMFFAAQGKSFTYQQDRRIQEDCSPIDRLQFGQLGFNSSQAGISFVYNYSFGRTDSYSPSSTDEKRVQFTMGGFNTAVPDLAWTTGDPLLKDTVAGIVYDSVSHISVQKYHDGKGYTYSTVSFKPGVGFLKIVINTAQPKETPVYDTYEWIP